MTDSHCMVAIGDWSYLYFEGRRAEIRAEGSRTATSHRTSTLLEGTCSVAKVTCEIKVNVR